MKGVYLWRLASETAVLLSKNERQRNDDDYCHLLERVRDGRSGDAKYNRTAFDYRTLQNRLIQNFDAETCTRFANAPVIVGRKVVRDPLNYRLAQHHANSISAEYHIYYSRDRVD